MRILFFMRNIGYVRNFEWVIRRLAEKGYQVRVVIDRRKMESSEQAVYAHLDDLAGTHRNIQFDELLRRAKDTNVLFIAARYVRLLQDYIRYLDPAFADAPKLRERCAHFLHPGLRWIVDRIGKSSLARRGFTAFLGRLDYLIPPPDHISEYIRTASPDLVMVTPLLDFGSPQPDYFKATRKLGVHSCLPVASWDNLTSKGLINVRPDRILVWNEAQKREAVEMHGIAAQNVFVTGAHSYDHWFTWEPSTTREKFVADIGLDPALPYILFLGSSRFIAPNEPPVVLKWANALRTSGDPVLEKVGILIRPHPQNGESWSNVDVSPLGNTVVHPRQGSNPVSRDAKAEYYDSMYHCRLVVGVNTSGLIEAGILGKSVHTVLFEEFAGTQEGTLHFHYLSEGSAGLLHVSPTLAEHLRELAAALREPSDDARRSENFVRHFVRPAALTRLPTETFVAVLEDQLSTAAPEPASLTFGTFLARAFAAPLLVFCLPQYMQGVRRRRAKLKEKRAAGGPGLKKSITDTRGGAK